MNQSSSGVRSIILRVSQEDYDRISQWKKGRKESWERYILGLIDLIESEIYAS